MERDQANRRGDRMERDQSDRRGDRVDRDPQDRRFREERPNRTEVRDRLGRRDREERGQQDTRDKFQRGQNRSDSDRYAFKLFHLSKYISYCQF